MELNCLATVKVITTNVFLRLVQMLDLEENQALIFHGVFRCRKLYSFLYVFTNCLL